MYAICITSYIVLHLSNKSSTNVTYKISSAHVAHLTLGRVWDVSGTSQSTILTLLC